MAVLRLVGAGALAALVLTGCASGSAGSFTREQAQADAVGWSRQALAAVRDDVGTKVVATTKASGFETCRTDTGFFTTTDQWRLISDFAVPEARQVAATAAIAGAFETAHWKQASKAGLTTLSGPSGAAHEGLIVLQTDGPTNLNVEVISPCYQ